MPRMLLPTLLLILASAAAHAEDFSGFYAGLNGGYAGGRGGDRSVAARTLRDRNAVGLGRGDPDLPPSAVGAAASMKGAGPRGCAAR